MKTGCPFQTPKDKDIVCHTGCLAARLEGANRICAGSEFDPLDSEEWQDEDYENVGLDPRNGMPFGDK